MKRYAIVLLLACACGSEDVPVPVLLETAVHLNGGPESRTALHRFVRDADPRRGSEAGTGTVEETLVTLESEGRFFAAALPGAGEAGTYSGGFGTPDSPQAGFLFVDGERVYLSDPSCEMEVESAEPFTANLAACRMRETNLDALDFSDESAPKGNADGGSLEVTLSVRIVYDGEASSSAYEEPDRAEPLPSRITGRVSPEEALCAQAVHSASLAKHYMTKAKDNLNGLRNAKWCFLCRLGFVSRILWNVRMGVGPYKDAKSKRFYCDAKSLQFVYATVVVHKVETSVPWYFLL